MESEIEFARQAVSEMDIATLLRWKIAVDNRTKDFEEAKVGAKALLKAQLQIQFVQVMVNDLSEASFKKWRGAVYLRIRKDAVHEFNHPSVQG